MKTMTLAIAALVSACGLTACSVLPTGAISSAEAPRAASAGSSASSRDVVDGSSAQSPSAGATAAEPTEASAPVARGFRFSAADLAVWNDPDFQREFAESYKAATDIEPAVTLVERERMQKVLELISSDRSEEAIKILLDARAPGSSAVFDFALGNVYFQRDELVEAVQAYDRAVTKFPKFRRAWKNLGLIHARRNEFGDAASALTRVVALGGSDAVTYGLLGFAYGSLGNHVSSESAYRMATLLDPDTMDWKLGLARAFFEGKRYADAVALCDTMIANEPERADLWLLQANAYIGMDEPLRAAENFELVDRLGASTAESLHNLADIYINEKLFSVAVDTYLRAIERAPGAGKTRALRAAKVLALHGELDETERMVRGIQAYQRDFLSKSQQKDLLKLQARLATAEGDGAEEARVLEEIVSLDPLDGEALILLGQHAGRFGDTEQAIFWFERAEGLEDHEADAKVEHAQILVRDGRYDEALPLLRRAETLQPRDSVREYLEQVERAAKSR